MAFKKDDIIRGKEGCDEYSITNEYCTMVCLEDEDEDGDVEVRIIGHEINDDVVGDEEMVEAQYFELVPVKNAGRTYSTSSSSTSRKNTGFPVQKLAISSDKRKLLKIKKI